MMNYKKFYEELGNLFYAIAAADKKIIPEERKRVDDVIRFSWKLLNNGTDRFGTNEAYRIRFEFDTMEEFRSKPGDAWKSFLAYFNKNKKEMDHDLRLRVFNSASHIAEGMKSMNGEKKAYLTKLKKLMKV